MWNKFLFNRKLVSSVHMIKHFSHKYLAICGGDPKKTGFSFKKKIYLHFEQKTLNPLQNTLHWRQYTCPIFFPTV